ncbi:ABC transporter permease [Williamsia serinedens]|uniref:Oligopeptide transport system permease protein OppC n=1 Tax=Williamsia serinedens TaxID=391736 RepID=A0ABT1H7R9_9NOCA|nr:ABC transporter permease [Williamsia serinedens]MCP2161843.1 peptide/nickel transport system permease protein [Williamsia serinedens]
MTVPIRPSGDSADPGADAPDDLGPVGEVSAPISRRRLVVRRFLRNKLAVFGIVLLLLLVVAAFALPSVIPYGYEEIDPFALNTPPTTQHWFGTNQIGQDVLAQTLRGLQKSLVIGFLVAIISTVIAGVVGAAAGYFGTWPDRVLMWIADALLVVPSFLIIAIASPAFRGKSFLILVLLLAAFSWMITSRIVRALTRSLREREYIRAARYMGASPTTIIGKHILPAMASILIVDVTLNVGIAIIGEATLSYFGFGVQRPDVSLGTLIADGTSSALTYPWLFAFCCGALVLIVLAANFIGDGLRDAFDPTSGRGQARD